MASFAVHMNIDGSAFDNPAQEVARILRELATDIEAEGLDNYQRIFRIQDGYGNRVGFAHQAE